MNTVTGIPEGATIPLVEAEEATTTPMAIDNPNIDDQQRPIEDYVMGDVDDMNINEDIVDDDPVTRKKHAERALERVRAAQLVLTKALREESKFVEFHHRKPEVPMTEDAIIRKSKLENRVTTTEDELKQAKLQHQRLYQAYKDLVMQDQEQSSDTEYPMFGKRTTMPKQEKFVGVKPDRNDSKHLAL
ncbi:hypothetical protein BGX26_007195, partial [Mortierella sp. AD094]